MKTDFDEHCTEFLMGYRCIVSSYRVQKKTSKWKLLNWIYKKVYGYEEKSYLPDGTGCLVDKANQVIYFRSRELMNKALAEVE